MAGELHRGDDALVDIEIRGIDGVLGDPTSLTLTIVTPAGALAEHVYPGTPLITKRGVGLYRAIWPLPESGIWLYQFVSVSPGQVGGGSLYVGPAPIDPGYVPAPRWQPAVSQVAAILRARTKGAASRDAATAMEQGTFTDATRPTYGQVLELIELVTGELSGMMQGRTPCTEGLAVSATTAAAYRAAQLVEISYFPEQTNGEQTAFAALAKMWQESSASIAKAVVEQCPLPEPLDPEGNPLGTGHPIGRTPARIPTTWQSRF